MKKITTVRGDSGLGLAILLPAVIRSIYPKAADILAHVLQPMVPGLKADPSDADRAAEGVRSWLASVGITETLADVGFQKSDITKLVDLVFTTPGLAGIAACAPVEATREVVERIYTDSF